MNRNFCSAVGNQHAQNLSKFGVCQDDSPRRRFQPMSPAEVVITENGKDSPATAFYFGFK